MRVYLSCLLIVASMAFADQPVQDLESRIFDTVRAVAYSGFREGQHPDRGDGANNPSEEEILEDLKILVDHDFSLIRLYDAGENSRQTLELIREHNLPIKVLLGLWLRAEVSNHEGCPWLDEPIPDAELAANVLLNQKEIAEGIRLANDFPDSVVAINVGNEARVEWNDHMVTDEALVDYIKQVQKAVDVPVTTADNYDWWATSGHAVAEASDFLGVHTYPAWEDKTIDEAMDYTIDNIRRVSEEFPDKPIAILEAGWATTASEFEERAGEPEQARYFTELMQWGEDNNVTIFFFEAFDEPWKGNPDNALGAEKHWGLFFVDRTPKKVMRRK